MSAIEGLRFEDCEPPDLRWERCVGRYGTPGFYSPVTGAVLAGHQPGECRQNTSESVPRDQLAEQLRGLIEVSFPFGQADVCTEQDVFEVEPFRSWTKGVLQALAYAAQTGMRPNIALMGDSTRQDRIAIYRKLARRLPMTGLGWPCKLWIHQPSGWWEPITSVKAAQRRPR